MKLIDLEKINLDNSLIEIITDMINQPIIDAIPVDWIKRWCDNRWGVYEGVGVQDMLKDWEKENETN